MKFRRRSGRSREPLFWTRSLFSQTVVVDVAFNGNPIQNTVVQNVDQLAVGGVTFSGIDERYTARRVLWPHVTNLTAGATSGDRAVICWWVVVKTSTSALAALIGQPLTDILAGGGVTIPAAMDVLSYHMQEWITVASSHGFVTGTQVNEPMDYDLVARRLEADECLALLTGGALSAGETFAAGGSSTFHNTYEISTLYSRTMRKR